MDLDRLRPKARIRLPETGEVVTLVAVTSGTFWEFFYEGPTGTGKIVLAEGELGRIELVETPDRMTFDGDPVTFRLGMESRRIEIAFAYDMAAIAVSNVRPLPHQLEAVYDCFLREPRLRYLLADDPGAGKTIMAGLYMKELILRRAGDRILVVTPANLRPQWIRELSERFLLDFQQLQASNFDASLTRNPWDQFDRIVVSRDFLRTDRAREAFVGAEKDWDLAVIDEVHGFTLSVDAKGYIKSRSERYKAAEEVSRRCHRLILMSATPHSGRDSSLWGSLRLLDLDAWGDHMPKKLDVPKAVFRKVSKEIMTDMAGNKLFKPRHPQTLAYELDGDELELYEAVTEFVSTKLAEIRGQSARTTAGFALTTMQRRLASSVRAIRRTLERRIERLDKAIADPATYLRGRKTFLQSIDVDESDADDLDEDDRWKLEEAALEEWLPDTVAELSAEREALGPLLTMAQDLEAKRSEKKLTELMDVVRSEGLKEDRRKQLLIFTEHKDTLDYLVENLSKDFEVAVIHGRMRLPERIAQERFFRERAQIMVATEAAGEGINLQFCHLMVNYDIPWNPNRLEQRMGRIHRIGQTEEVYIFNLVASNTREGYVLATILRKMENMGIALGDKVFDVIGSTFAGYRLRELLEAVLAGELSKEKAVEELGGVEADPRTVARANELLQDALARHYIDWEAERDRAARAEERRLPPAYFERFFIDAMEFAGGRVSRRLDPGALRVDRTPDVLVALSRIASATRPVAPTYARITFEKTVATRPRREDDEAALPQAELCGPGHPLFDELVKLIIDRTAPQMAKGAMFLDPDVDEPTVLHFLIGEVVDGNEEVVRRTLAVARVVSNRTEPGSAASLFDVVPVQGEMVLPSLAAPLTEVAATDLIRWSRLHLFESHYEHAKKERQHVAKVQDDFLRRSFGGLLADAEGAIMSAEDEIDRRVPGAEGRLRKAELAKEQIEQKRLRRLAETERGRAVARGGVTIVGSTLLLPVELADVSEKQSTRDPGDTDKAVEAIAIQVARSYEIGRGATVHSVEADNVGFDLLSSLGLERRCIEVKGRAGVGGVELTWSEFAKGQELADDYWLYVVLDCREPEPRLYRVPNPAKTLASAWRPSLDVRYLVDPEPVIEAARGARK